MNILPPGKIPVMSMHMHVMSAEISLQDARTVVEVTLRKNRDRNGTGGQRKKNDQTT